MNPTTLPGWRWMTGMAPVRPDGMVGCVIGADDLTEGELAELAGCGLDADDPATGGALAVLLGPEAWRVRYSPSQHKQAAGVPWLATHPTPDGKVLTTTMHASLGDACVAVAVALGRWPGGGA